MVGGTQPQQQTPPPTIPTTTTTTTPTSAEEEALKRNTDCVYFLASPLTCKKGAECEYRHSDIARVNPRDCWFWLNGNCLNPKCGFRHPPLDGLLGTQVPTPVGSSLPPSQTAATPVASAPYNSAKQAVPCIFFQKGFCLKGDRCPFSHAPSTVNNKVPQGPVATTSEPPTLKKAFSGLEKCSQEQKAPQANIPKSGELLSQAKPQDKVETAPPKNAPAYDRHVTPYSALDNQPPRYRPTNVPPVTSGNSISRSNHVEQGHVSVEQGILNSKDADEFSREPSPGFDVLVDDDLRDSDYYHNEDHYGGTRAHEGRNLNSMNDYDSMIDVDQDMYRDPHGYDSYECVQGQYAREQRRASSERMLGGSAHLERKLYPRAESPDQIQVSDLRHHLSKQKRVNGLRSVISHDRVRDSHAVDRSYRGPSRRDVHHLPQNESSVSSRLRGRIRLPGRSSSPVNGSELHSESEMERGRNRGGRSSPERSHISTHHGRFRDRIKGRVQEDINNDGRSLRGRVQEDVNNDGRNLRGLRTRDIMNGNNPNFDGPKSLAELKGGKTAEGNEQQMNDQKSLTLGKRKYPKLEHQFESESSFEGPKPLSEILKRKRAAEIPVRGSGLMAVTEDICQKEEKESLTSSLKTTAGLSKEQANLSVHSNKEETRFPRADDARAEGRDGLIPREGTISAYGQSHHKRNLSELETEDGMTCDDTMEDHEPETFDQRDGESDYEQVDGEDYNLDEAENAEAEEYLDDDDGDDFAKKIGVMFS